MAAVTAAWGGPEADAPDGVFRFRAARFGKVVGGAGAGPGAERRPAGGLSRSGAAAAACAGGLRARGCARRSACHALVHVGAHGTLEWLPGKTVALSAGLLSRRWSPGRCRSSIRSSSRNPGEAAQAKRRIAAVTLGHLTPPLVGAGLCEAAAGAGAAGRRVCPGRRARPAAARPAGAADRRDGAGERAGGGGGRRRGRRSGGGAGADRRLALRPQGLRDQGRAARLRPGGGRATRRSGVACAEAERAALLAALDGRHVAPGPAGAPARGRTRRAADRAQPLRRRSADAADADRLRARARRRPTRCCGGIVQEHGDWPRALVIDLWGSASLRTGGEAIAQGLALMGCRPVWDEATARVTGVEVLPPAAVGRPRVDVTWRISGLFRDMFASADRADRRRGGGGGGARGERRRRTRWWRRGRGRGGSSASAPGTYGAGPEERLASGDWDERAELGRAYLDGGRASPSAAPRARARAAEGAFAERVAAAELLVHPGDDPGRDLLEGSADVAFVGGFAAAVAALGGQGRSGDARHHRPGAAAGAVAGGGGDAGGAGAGDEPAVHRRADAARAAGGGGVRRDGGPAGRLRRDDGRGGRGADRGGARGLCRGPGGAGVPAATRTRRRRGRSPSASPRRGGGGSGIRGATRSTTSWRRCVAEALAREVAA